MKAADDFHHFVHTLATLFPGNLGCQEILRPGTDADTEAETTEQDDGPRHLPEIARRGDDVLVTIDDGAFLAGEGGVGGAGDDVLEGGLGDDVVAGDDISFSDPEAADGGGLGGGFFDAGSSLAETTAEWVLAHG